MSRTSQRARALKEARYLEDLMEKARRIMAASYINEIELLQRKVSLAAIEKAIRAHKKDVVDPELIKKAAEVLSKVVTEQSIKTSKRLAARVGDGIDYDAENKGAAKAMLKREKLYEERFGKEQTKTIKRTIAEGVRRGENPRVIARDIRNGLGLSDYESQIVANYRRALERDEDTTRYKLRDRRVDSGDRSKGLSQATIDKAVARYRERRINHRAEMISRRDAHTAIHEGQDLMWDQAVENGDVEKDEMIQEWISTNDDRARPHHVAMDGQLRPIGKPFVSGLGNKLMYPGDPSAPPEEIEGCRCTVATVFK